MMSPVSQSSPTPPISGDRPIEVVADDKLGFQALAEKLARALVEQASADSMVVGLEGRWGSGKSSLLNLMLKALSELPTDNRPIVVEFKPWLIGDRDALLGAFFDDLAKVIEEVQLEAGHSAIGDQRKRRELAERIRGYSAKAEVFGSVLAAIPAAGILGKVVKGIAAAGKSIKSKASLLVLKKELDGALAELPRRIIVSIDDVDRLEPREVIELLRLVRSVADFKNLTYVLCYDGRILAQSIQSAINVPDGRAYLEKIVQVEIAVPIPEPFRLRRWFEEALKRLVGGFSAEQQPRIASVIDTEGGRRLSTPRHVVRVLNALHLLVPALQDDDVDLADLVWLQIIKLDNHSLYRWIEDYSSSSAVALSWRVSISDEGRRRSFKSLKEALDLDGMTFESFRYDLADHLPGIGRLSIGSDNDKIPIYANIDRHSLESAIAGRRLASPDHYRLYFALAQPSTAPRAEDYEQLLAAASTSPEAFSKLFESWMRATDISIGSKADLMLDRLQQRGSEGLSAEQAEVILRSLSEVADEAGQFYSRDDFGSPSIWRETERTLPTLLDALDPERRLGIIADLFSEGRAVGWLTRILRREIFAHGRYGNQRQDETKWFLADAELDQVIEIMIGRYRAMTLTEFAAIPNTLSALFAWYQAGDEEGPKGLIARASETDAGFITALEVMSSQVHSSGGDYFVLNRENSEPFVDIGAARLRVEEIASSGDSGLRARAKVLLANIKNAER